MSGLLSTFKSLFSSGDERFTPAYRPLFAVDFSFPTGKPSFISTYDIDNLRYLVQNVDLPNFQIESKDDLEVNNFVGSFKGPGNANIIPESQAFAIGFIDAEQSVHEEFFLPWLKEVVDSQKKNSNKYPFTRCNVNVSLFKNNVDTNNYKESDVKITYTISGVYPNRIDSPSLAYGPQGEMPIRSVGFEFNKVNAVINRSATNILLDYRGLKPNKATRFNPSNPSNPFNPLDF